MRSSRANQIIKNKKILIHIFIVPSIIIIYAVVVLLRCTPNKQQYDLTLSCETEIMPNNKKASGKKKEKKVQKNLNNDNLEALKRLSSALSSLGNETKATTESNEEGKIIGYPLSHWRELNEDVNNAYKMLFDGAELIRATSTKYTLVGKIDINDGSRFSVSI